MKLYLAPTEYCNSDSLGIREAARHITRKCDTDRSRAVRVFEWVQDEIPYRIFCDWTQKASETLEMRGGACTNKANLFVALMRALGVPAGFHVLLVNGQRYFGPVWVPTVARLCSQRSVHVHPAVYLDGRWIKCDPTDDIGVTNGTAHVNPPSGRVVFDGERDATLNLDQAHVYSHSECLPNIDEVLRKRSNKPPVFFWMMDTYLEFGRRYGAQYDIVNGEQAFRTWVAENHPSEYSEFLSLERALLAAPA